MATKLTVLISPIDAVGHFNASIGIGEKLLERGHKVVFTVPDSWRNKLTPYGFIEEWLNPYKDGDDKALDLEAWGGIVAQMAPAFQLSPEDQAKTLTVTLFKEVIRQTKLFEPRLKEIVAKVKPDIIVTDMVTHQPATMDAGIPWILCFSVSPTGISGKNVPPAFSGYPCGEEHRKSWDHYKKEFIDASKDMFDDFNNWVVENGGPQLKHYGQPYFLKYSPYANIYQIPEELDYTVFRPNPPNFHRFDTFVRSAKDPFVIPLELKNKPGKLIYFSMGTIGCSELGVMRRLIAILAKSPHRFIVSKGPLGAQIELADNMWGENFLPQPAILACVNLVISHGGNNTTSEAFFYGKPLIILPLFGDQPDNAQRVEETGFGLRFHPYKVTEDELLSGIEKMLQDDNLTAKLARIGKRIREANNQTRIADLVEKVALNTM